MTKSRGTKAIAAILISSAMVLSFAACEAEKPPSGTVGTTTASADTEAAATAVATTEPEEPSAEDYEYFEADGEITITGYYGSDREAVIPAVIDGKPVTGIADSAFRECETLISVTIPDSVEEIGGGAFSLCTALENVSFPNHAAEIGEYAFDRTPWLEKMRAEDPLVIVNGTLIDGQNCSGDVTIPDGVQLIAAGAFWDSTVTSVTIPDSVTGIGDWVFYDCVGLTSAAIPNSVTEIGRGVFSGCGSLTSVTIPDSAVGIVSYAFSGCGALESIAIPDGVTEIGDYAFYNCGSLTSVTLPDGLQTLGNAVFGECSCEVTYQGKTYSPDLYTDLYEAVNSAE